MTPRLIDDETRYRLIKQIEKTPEISQRELAAELGLSLGKVNYCLKALIGVGLIKAGNFARSSNKVGYAYFLTPAGAKEKAAMTIRFLEAKQQQYDMLRKEIELLKKEIAERDENTK
jgi:EPS-associated MarR family transcriptional regulator